MTRRLEHATAQTSEPRPDAALVEALRMGDEGAFLEVVERYHGSLVRLAQLYVAAGTAEDVVQETWLALLRGIDRFEGRASLKTWLFRVLVNRARTRAARDARTISFSSLTESEIEASEPAVRPDRFRGLSDRWPGHWLAPPPSAELPDARLLSDELRTKIGAAVAALPPAQRAVVALRDIDGLRSEEVCELLDLSEGNQRVLLHRGRSRVRAALEQYIAETRS
jgi:RNA polymerase sigma-70 factor (ECF subfamily)